MTAETPQETNSALEIEELGNGRRRVRISSAGTTDSCETSYPPELIEAILASTGPGWLCDEIRRDEDPHYVERSLRLALLAYVDESAFAGKRLLDFGCGSGASSFVLARMFPTAEIVGVEIVESFVEVANKRGDYYREPRVTFQHSPDPEGLPEGIGEFDVIILSAVYEHLLPAERRTLLPRLWSHLAAGGLFFVNQLPNRHSPIDNHTTGLPLINYMPDRAAHAIANRFSKRIPGDESWDVLLRRGIRGGSPGQVQRDLDPAGSAMLLEPSRLGLENRIDLWFALSSGSRLPRVKRAVHLTLNGVQKTTGLVAVPELSLAFRKS
jgi:2-polyprenyl-3-methyl-5-hydroxy-6-metoxy-1,4-benzoquinol methylase